MIKVEVVEDDTQFNQWGVAALQMSDLFSTKEDYYQWIFYHGIGLNHL